MERGNEIKLADFGTGILAGIAAEGYSSISVRGLDAKLVDAYEWMVSVADEFNVVIKFSISQNRIHGDAPEGRKAIGGAVSRGMGSFDNDHSLYLSFDSEGADNYFKRLPGSAELWRAAARKVTAW